MLEELVQLSQQVLDLHTRTLANEAISTAIAAELERRDPGTIENIVAAARRRVELLGDADGEAAKMLEQITHFAVRARQSADG